QSLSQSKTKRMVKISPTVTEAPTAPVETEPTATAIPTAPVVRPMEQAMTVPVTKPEKTVAMATPMVQLTETVPTRLTVTSLLRNSQQTPRDPSKRTAHQRQNLQRNWDPQLKMKNQMKCPNEMVERLPMTMTIVLRRSAS